MSPCWFNLEPIFLKLWPGEFFLTAHNFANGSHFVALTQPRATETGSKICCTHLSYTFSESWVHKDSVGTYPEEFSHWKFSSRSDLQTSSVFHWFPLPPPKISIGLVYTQFWCHRPSQYLCNVIPLSFQGQPKSWPKPKSLAYSSSQSQVTQISCRPKWLLLGVF